MLRILVACVLLVALMLLIAFLRPSPLRAACHPIPVTASSPTGIAGCELYGSGIASWWQGPGVARNDCIWPWNDCAPIRITSLDTGLSIVAYPTTFCDCYTGTPNQRLVDLGPSALQELGLWDIRARGLFPVRVSIASSGALPNTAMGVGSMADVWLAAALVFIAICTVGVVLYVEGRRSHSGPGGP